MIAVVPSILVGAGIALLLDAAGMPLPAAVIVGVAAVLPAYGLHVLWMYRRTRPRTSSGGEDEISAACPEAMRGDHLPPCCAVP